jgi:hypothetical protein
MEAKEYPLIICHLLAALALVLLGCASLPSEHYDSVGGRQGAVSASSAHNRPDVRKAKRTQTDMEPNCAICEKPPSKIRRNDAHHALPVSYDPLELQVADLDNLETLCRSCHFRWGHAGNWSRYNTNLIECIERVHAARALIRRNTP